LTVNHIFSGENLGFILRPILVLQETVRPREGVLAIWKILDDGLLLFVKFELLIFE